MSAPAEFFADPALGFRTWIPRYGWVLGALTGRAAWVPGVNAARCDPMAPGEHHAHLHAVPADGCHCGLYAFHEPPEGLFPGGSRRVTDPEVVVGAVAGWGRVQVHAHGWRAERAVILALAWHETWPLKQRLATFRAAKAYGASYVHLGRLAEVAARDARTIDQEHRPSANALEPKITIKPRTSQTRAAFVRTLTAALSTNVTFTLSDSAKAASRKLEIFAARQSRLEHRSSAFWSGMLVLSEMAVFLALGSWLALAIAAIAAPVTLIHLLRMRRCTRAARRLEAELQAPP